MTPHILLQLDFNLEYSRKLVKDLTEEQMTTSPFPGLENHPAFTLGHLATARALIVEDLGGRYEVPEGWKELFQRDGPGDPRLPSTDVKSYPGKNELLNELKNQQEKIKSLLLKMDEKILSQNIKWRFSKYFPALSDLTLFMSVNHEAMHLGQLAAWRRAMKLPSALGVM